MMDTTVLETCTGI